MMLSTGEIPSLKNTVRKEASDTRYRTGWANPDIGDRKILGLQDFVWVI